ncbi:MAG: hypothetical protein HY000_30905 [Planctomycetes bacterium]|nr:hypothetical protein [Planctomycetota bacterium]
MRVYEQLLDRDTRWALHEGSMHFEEKSAVHDALHRLVERLTQLGIDYAVAGAMALFLHGYRRFTEDVDVLVTPEGLRAVHDQLSGRGYLPLFAGSKSLRDTESGVRIEFLVTGQYPGDDKPKPVAFPVPADCSVERGGIKCVGLAKLVELKLASGITNPGRLKDLADVQEVIRVLGMPRDFADQLNPFVRERYRELWDGAQTDAAERGP